MSRQVRIRIAGDIAARLFLEGATHAARIEKGLPAGARYVRCFDESPARGTFDLVFEHESFPGVVSGDPIPCLDVLLRDISGVQP